VGQLQDFQPPCDQSPSARCNHCPRRTGSFQLVEKIPRARNLDGILTVVAGQSTLDPADIYIPGPRVLT
jgi:hypothetical protein